MTMSSTQNQAGMLPNASALFDLSDDQREVLWAADTYARNELYPLAEKMDADESWPDVAFRKLGRDGYFGITTPPELGGLGGDLFTSGLVRGA
jgi:isovaleryl-CoA dehydrogenase